MKPPVCCVCDRRLRLGEGGVVAFSDYEPLPDGLVGRPAGLEWFCPAHLEAGRALRHRHRDPAVARLRGEWPVKAVPAPSPLRVKAGPSPTPPPRRPRNPH